MCTCVGVDSVENVCVHVSVRGESVTVGKRERVGATQKLFKPSTPLDGNNVK